MVSRNLILKAVKEYNHTKAFYFFPADQVKPKQINGAIARWARDVSASSVVALMDTTLFESGKEGFLLTQDKLYTRMMDQSVIPLDGLSYFSRNDSYLVAHYKSGSTVRFYASIYAEDIQHFFDHLLALIRQEEEAIAARKRQEEAAQKRAQEEAARRLAEAAQRRAQEEAARRQAEAERKRAQEEAARRQAEAARKRAQEEAARKQAQEADAKKAQLAASLTQVLNSYSTQKSQQNSLAQDSVDDFYSPVPETAVSQTAGPGAAAYINCRHCGGVNAAGTLLCDYCGLYLPEPAQRPGKSSGYDAESQKESTLDGGKSDFYW